MNQTDTSKISSGRNRLLFLALLLSEVLATLQFIRAYFIVDQPYLDAARYEAGTEKLPYQARAFMAAVMQGANHNAVMAKLAQRLRGPLHAPDVLAQVLIDLLAMGIIAWVARSMYRHLSPHGNLSAMPYFLVLWMAAETYIVRFQEAIYFPYDLLAAALFFLCLYLAYSERYLALIPVFLLACWNRETIIMIVPLLLANAFTTGKPHRRRNNFAVAALLLSGWVAIHFVLLHRYSHNDSEVGLRLRENLHLLANPQIWPQIASACGFLLPVPFLFWRLLPEPRLRLYALLIPCWCVIMFAVGLIAESRVFGELIGLVAVLCTLIFERSQYGRPIGHITR